MPPRPPTPARSRAAAQGAAGAAFGPLLRAWRARRGVSQHALALAADVSQRHLSFVELGLARASRELVARLCEQLDVPLRERNQLLLAAGFAPAFPQGALGDPALAPARDVVAHVLAAQAPAPAVAVDRHWTVLAANRAVAPVLYAGASPALLRPPVNILRVMLHPEGLAPRIANLGAWRSGVLGYLARAAGATGDAGLTALLDELRRYEPAAASPGWAESGMAERAAGEPAAAGAAPLFLPLALRTAAGPVRLLSAVTTFATPTAVVLAELLIESFYPADAASRERLRDLVAGDGGGAAVSAAATARARG